MYCGTGTRMERIMWQAQRQTQHYTETGWDLWTGGINMVSGQLIIHTGKT